MQNNLPIRQCQSCGFQQDPCYSYCGHCGQALTLQCTRCQQHLPGHFRYCGYCSYPLLPYQAQQPGPQAEPRPISVAQSAPVVQPKPDPIARPAAPSSQAAPIPEPQPVEYLPSPVPAAPSAAASEPPPLPTPEPQAVEAIPAALPTGPEAARSNAPLPQSAVARVSERRQVAVLFCDVCGFTAMSESLDPEEVSNIIQPLFQESNAIINKYGGVVEKFIGDAIMALFGVPYLHEDDPERAAMAALELREFIQDYGQKLQQSHGFSVNMRIGLNVGMVVAGSVSAGEGTNYQVMGDAINTAARMEQNAQPGHILVTAGMYRLIKHSFNLRSDKLIQAKGKAEPLQAYELLGIRRLQQRSRGFENNLLPLVDRQAELQRLLSSAKQGFESQQLTSLLITGESGLGKTRLAIEVYEGLKETQAELRLLRAGPTSYSQHFSYFVIQNLIRSCLEIDETWSHTQVVERLQQFISEIQIPNGSMITSLLEYTLYPHLELPQLKFIAPERLQKQIFKAIGDVLNAMAAQQPLFILIDDLQWCDPLSLQWLQQIQPKNQQHSLQALICVTMRLGAAGDETNLRWECHQSLQPLSDESCNQMICHILALDPHAGLPFQLGSLGEAILTRAAGNPYYIEEVLNNLLEDELLVKKDDSWELTCSLRELPLPSSIQRLIMARFDRLEPEYRELLQTISALGNTTGLSLLATLAGLNHELLHQHLEVLAQVGFIRLSQTPRGLECSFLQALTQEVVYNTMVNRRKIALHQQIAETLEKHHSADPYPVLDLLAYHFSRTKELPKAIRYLYVAAEQASRLYANALALEHYNHLLELLSQVDAGTLISTDLFQREWMKLPQLREKAMRRRAEVLLLIGAYDEVLSLVSQALTQTESVIERAKLMYCQGRVLEKRSEYKQARETYQQARQLLESQSEIREQARLWNAIGWVCRWMGDYDQALAACQAALALLEQQPDMEQIAYAHNVMGVVHYYRHSWEESLADYGQSLTIQRQIQDTWGHANSLSNMGNVYFMTNRWQEAVSVFKESLELREQLGDSEGVATSCNNLGHALQELGQLQEAEAYLQRASEQYRQMGHRLGEATASCNLGGIAYRQKQWAKALELLDAGIASMEAQQLQGLLSEVYNHRIEIYLEQNELEIALKYLSLNSPEVHEHGDPIQQGRLERLWGHYYLKTQQLENAKEHLHKALDLLQPSGHRIECQLLYRDLADWHRSSGSHESAYWEEASQNLLAEEVAP